MSLLPPALLYLVLAAWLAARHPAKAVAAWILLVECTPESWLTAFTGIGAYETIIAVVKASGLGLVLVLGLRHGWRRDRWNPAFAFALMFATGLVHGLWPGLTPASSLRSLLGSAAPFAFAFVRLEGATRRAVQGAVLLGPTLAVLLGLLLQAAGIHPAYEVQLGALRLAGAGDPADLGGFAVIALYAAAVSHAREGGGAALGWIALNALILLLTGARAPLAAGAAVVLAALFLTPAAAGAAWRKAKLAAGILCAGALLAPFLAMLGFIRAVGLTERGDAVALSHRELVWPHFEAAIRASPLFGWGVGAGKDIVPLGGRLAALIGTNAAHDEYLRIAAEGGVVGLALLAGCLVLWVARGTTALPRPERMIARLVFIAFAGHSITDNTLIATTSSAMFIWASALFQDAEPCSLHETDPA